MFYWLKKSSASWATMSAVTPTSSGVASLARGAWRGGSPEVAFSHLPSLVDCVPLTNHVREDVIFHRQRGVVLGDRHSGRVRPQVEADEGGSALCLAASRFDHTGERHREGLQRLNGRGGLDSIVFFSCVVDAVLGCFDAVFARVVEAFRWLVFFFEVFFPLFFFEALVVPVFFFTVRRALVRPATTLFELFFFCGMWSFFRVRRPSVRVRTVFLSMFFGSSPTNLIAWRGVSGSGNIKCRHTPIW